MGEFLKFSGLGFLTGKLGVINYPTSELWPEYTLNTLSTILGTEIRPIINIIMGEKP